MAGTSPVKVESVKCDRNQVVPKPASPKPPDGVRCELGLDGLNVRLQPDFDGPAFSRRVIGLED